MSGVIQSSSAATVATLVDLIARKRMLDSDLVELEKNIAEAETNYIQTTNNYGNIIKGWDQFLMKPIDNPNKSLNVPLKSRIFSQSSATAPLQVTPEVSEVEEERLSGAEVERMVDSDEDDADYEIP
eukprot:175893_1